VQNIDYEQYIRFYPFTYGYKRIYPTNLRLTLATTLTFESSM